MNGTLRLAEPGEKTLTFISIFFLLIPESESLKYKLFMLTEETGMNILCFCVCVFPAFVSFLYLFSVKSPLEIFCQIAL